MPSFTGFFDILLHPKEAAQAYVKDADWKRATIRYFLTGVIAAIVFSSIFSTGQLYFADPQNIVSGILDLIINAVFWGLFCTIFGVIGWWIFTQFANLIGTKSDFISNLYVGSRIFGPTALISFILFFIITTSLNPFLFYIFLIWPLWNAYVHVAAASGANKISMVKAFGLVLATAIILAAILFVVSPIIFPPIYYP